MSEVGEQVQKRKRVVDDATGCLEPCAEVALERVVSRRRAYRVPSSSAVSLMHPTPHTAEHVYDAAVVHGLVHVQTAEELLALWTKRQQSGVPFIVLNIAGAQE